MPAESTMTSADKQTESEDFITINFSDTSDSEHAETDIGITRIKRKADSDEAAAKDDIPDQGNYQTCYNNQPLPPWLKGHRRLGKGPKPDISEMINEEVTRFIDYISPTPEEHHMRLWVIERMQRVLDQLQMIDVKPKAQCFGSFETRLYLPTSDIDMTVMLHNEGTKEMSENYKSKEAVRRFLYTLARQMKKSGFCRDCEVIANARVPIIKTHEMVTGFAVDISINADSGFKSASVQRSFCERVYPDALRPMVLIIKQFLAQRSMNEVYTGGIGSYAITLLAVSMLQMHPRIRAGGLDVSKNLGVLLIEFFELYGKRFNYDTVCISVLEKGQYLDKRRKGFYNMNQPYLLSIEDPCELTNDVSKGSYGINRIKQTFGGAYDLLNNAIFAYHQTRKFGEPINDTLKALAGIPQGGDNSGPSRKRSKGSDGKAKKKNSQSAFNNDPWAPVSFLSSILNVNSRTINARAKLVETFYKGTLQSILGVQYQPQLVDALKSGKQVEVVVATENALDAQEQIDRMKFDFSKGRSNVQEPVIDISDEDEDGYVDEEDDELYYDENGNEYPYVIDDDDDEDEDEYYCDEGEY